jgi:murein DD-endopeptidase MepM/ murein hydrolase activator NlpD
MSSIKILSVLLCCVISLSLQASVRCSQQWACVEVQKSADKVDFYLRNNKAYTITMTLNVETDNLKLAPGFAAHDGNVDDTGGRVTETLKGGEKKWVLSYQRSSKYRRPVHYYDYEWAVGSLDVEHDDDYLYRLPYGVNDSHVIVQGFNGGYSHRGLAKYAVDFAMPVGSEVFAARKGTVVDVQSRHSKGGASRRYASYANFIVIEHSDGSTGEYYHLRQHGVLVKPGEQIKRGQLIGLSGNTGFTSLPHLHFAVYKALANGDTQSLAFKFVASSGVVDNPRHGGRYKVAKSE